MEVVIWYRMSHIYLSVYAYIYQHKWTGSLPGLHQKFDRSWLKLMARMHIAPKPTEQILVLIGIDE